MTLILSELTEQKDRSQKKMQSLFSTFILFNLDLEWKISKIGAIKSSMKSDPRGTNVDESSGFSMLSRSSRTRKESVSDDDDDY